MSNIPYPIIPLSTPGVRLEDWAVQYASDNEHLEVVKYLVSQGADVRVDDDYPIRMPSFDGHLEVVKYLASQGADIRTNDNDTVRSASRNGHLEVVKYLVSQGAPTINISEKVHHYISFCEKMEKKRENRAQKKIYFWWIPICYDVKRECGRRMAQKSFNMYKKME